MRWVLLRFIDLDEHFERDKSSQNTQSDRYPGIVDHLEHPARSMPPIWKFDPEQERSIFE
jgi:hypothetical protein